jgi:SAM-dependent methyltransferase
MDLESLRLENSVLTGDIAGERGLEHRDLSLDVYLDGKFCGSGSPIFPRLDRFGKMLSRTGAFRIHLPEVSRQKRILAEIRDGSTNAVFIRQEFDQLPTLSTYGLNAEAVIGIHRAPLVGIDGFALGQGSLSISGLVLSPSGDPRRVSLKADEGVAYEFIYPLPNPSARDIYWYWPNSDFSAFQLVIDLAQTISARNSYAFTFSFDGGDVDNCADIKNTFWIPKDINAYQNYPPQDNLKRVQTFDNISGVTVRGYSDSRRIWEIAKLYGLNGDGAKVLDWGVGHGRVIRHFRSLYAGVKPYGIDIDKENVAWARKHLAEVAISEGPLMPPTQYPDAEFDLVYGISVMTHLTRSVQEAWLEEIGRILRPGGMALLTFAGNTAAAFSSQFLEKAWMDEYLILGRGRDLPSGDLIGKISDPNYYRNVKISAAEVAKLCKPYFEVLGVLECMFGYQDLAVLRKSALQGN